MDFIKSIKEAVSQKKETLKENLNFLLGAGILDVLFGLFATIFVGFATLATISTIGFLFIFSGLVSIYFSIKFKALNGFWYSFIMGILATVSGVFMLRYPLEQATFITLIISIYFMVSGFIQMISCFIEDFDHKGMVFFGGLISVLCGYSIYTEWPFSGFWVIGTLVGVNFIYIGFTKIYIAMKAKKLIK